MADPYWVLGVPKTATKDEIKKAYRKLCMQHHPDRHALSPEHVQKNAAAAFKAVSEAYELLVNGHSPLDTRRAGYGQSHASRTSTSSSRGSYHDAYSQHFSGYGSNYTGYSQFRRRGQHFNFGGAFRSLTSFGRQEALLTLGVGGLILGGVLLFDPVTSSFWERQNQGKLFSHMEAELVAAQRDEQRRVRAQRAVAKENSGEAAVAAAEVAAERRLGQGEGLQGSAGRWVHRARVEQQGKGNRQGSGSDQAGGQQGHAEWFEGEQGGCQERDQREMQKGGAAAQQETPHCSLLQEGNVHGGSEEAGRVGGPVGRGSND